MHRLAESDTDLEPLIPVLQELRPTFEHDTLLAQLRTQRGEGYQFAWVEDAGKVLCVAGFVVANLAATRDP